MKQSSSLFQLIKALSKAEKRSFKLFASRHSNTEQVNYVILFDVLDKQKIYDEQALEKKLKGKISLESLPTVKVQLYNLILKSLRQLNSRNKATYKLRMYQDNIRILFEKGLYDQCKKILKKAYELAYTYDMYLTVDTLSITELEIAMKESNYEDLENYITNSAPKIREIRKLNEISAEYEVLLAKIKLLALESSRTGLTISKDKFDEIVNNELLQTEPTTLPNINQVDYHVIWGDYYNMMMNSEKSYYHRKKALNLLELEEPLLVENPQNWIYHSRLLLLTLGRFRMYKEFEHEEARIKEFVNKLSKANKTQTLNAEIYVTIYNTRLDFDLDRGLFASCSDYAKEAEKDFQLYFHQIDLNSKMVMYFNFSYAFFGNGEYHLALKWVNFLLHTNYGNVRIDLQCVSKLMNIAIHYELKNYDIIPSLVNSSSHFLTKLNRKFKLESSFLKFAAKHLTKAYDNSLNQAFQKEIDELLIIIEDPIEKKTSQYFDIINWLKSKILNQTMEEVYLQLPKEIEPSRTGTL